MFRKFFALFKGDTTDVRSLYCIICSVSWKVRICDIHNITWRSLIEEIFPPSVSLKFRSFFARISSLIYLIALIWVPLERSFPAAELEYRWCQFWSKLMTSEVEQRPTLVTADYVRHGSQWVRSQAPGKLTDCDDDFADLIWPSGEKFFL